MIDLLVPILAFLSVVLIGSAVLVVSAARRRSIEVRLGDGHAGVHAPVKRRGSAFGGLLRRMGDAASPGQASTKLKQNLARAGYYADTAAASYLGAKLLLLVVGVVGTSALMMSLDFNIFIKAYLVALVAAILFFVPNLVVTAHRRERCRQVRMYLPDAVDLIEICVSSGMGLDQAWNAVSEEIRGVCTVLADEMALVNLEMQLGAPRTEAMRNMAERTNADELSNLVALLIQSDRFGTSVAEALRTFANAMRESRSMQAEEAAEKMAVKLLFPLVFFIFPAMLIVMVGPAGIILFNVLGGGGS